MELVLDKKILIGPTVKPVYNNHPWDSKIVAIVHKWSPFRGFSIKIAIGFSLAGLRGAVVGRWAKLRARP